MTDRKAAQAAAAATVEIADRVRAAIAEDVLAATVEIAAIAGNAAAGSKVHRKSI